MLIPSDRVLNVFSVFFGNAFFAYQGADFAASASAEKTPPNNRGQNH
jgi:hypothetical protein